MAESTHLLHIDGMSCSHCVHALQEGLADVPGVLVEDVQIGSVRVRTAETASLDQVRAAVSEAGYGVRSVEPA